MIYKLANIKTKVVDAHIPFQSNKLMLLYNTKILQTTHSSNFYLIHFSVTLENDP